MALEEFPDYSSMKDSVFVRIANIPLQESIRDLRCGGHQQHQCLRGALVGCAVLCAGLFNPPSVRGHSAVHGSAACVSLPPPQCRHFHLNQLVRVDGVVTRRTGVYPQLQAS